MNAAIGSLTGVVALPTPATIINPEKMNGRKDGREWPKKGR
ncbi:hypothetical protein [Bacillus sp. ISL-41]|nr:hypothetical protein [Bacillus sp. ISL-41]